MRPGQTRTVWLSGGLRVTVMALDGMGTADLLRRAAHEADLYLLYGSTYSAPAEPAGDRTSTGPGFYVGMSAALLRSVRAGTSLRQWATQRGRLDPSLAILIRRPGRQLSPDLVRFCECHLIRTLFGEFELLNTVSGCPTAARRLSRHQVAFGLLLVDQVVRLIRGRWLHGVSGTPTGGSLHERIVRLVRQRGPLLTTEIVALAPTVGIPLGHHGTPTATVRRDGATRERDSRGPTRIRHTRVWAGNRRRTCLFYPPTMSRAEAVRAWRERTGTARGTGRRRRHHNPPDGG